MLFHIGEKTYEWAGHFCGLFYTNRESLLISLYETQMLSIPHICEWKSFLKLLCVIL
jgi:hypothetical protein